MSHQNTEDENTTTSETTLENDRELATALRAMALATQDPSPIFQLNVDCWEEIFDWLSVTDVHAFGQTCKFFHQIAGKYFEWKYRRALARVFNNEMDVYCKNLPGINEFAQRLPFFESESDTSLLYAFANYISLKELRIVYLRSTDLDINRLEKMLASVEILTFEYSCISDELMESILKICATNLRRLTIRKITRFDWMHRKYPTLQHLKLYDVNSGQELVQFFEANPNVRSFSTSVQNILEHKSEFMASTIELDDLTVFGDTSKDGISNAFNDLYNRGFYKRLHLTTYTKKLSADLPGLTTLVVGEINIIDLPHLSTVTRMSFRPLRDNARSFMRMDDFTDALMDALPNLECVLMHNEASMKYIMSFIRNSKKLKEINIQYYRQNTSRDTYIDPVRMNSEREKLNGAHKVTIYVMEKDYLRIKWKYNRTDFGLIVIKRHESYDGMWDHCFD